jgi:trimeric autotransporter adhesin
VTKSAAADTVATTAKSVITVGETTTSTVNGTAPTIDDVNITGSSKAPTASTDAAVATIKVSQLNAGLLNAEESFTATITGPGTLGSGAGNSGANITTPNPVGRALTVKNGDFVQVWSDGTSGAATITITSKAGLVLATETVTFFGAVASIVTTAQATVLNATTNNGDTVDKTTRPIKVVVKDAAGVSVSNAALKVTSETLTIVSDSYAACGSADYDATEQAYFCQLTGVAAGKTKITVGTKTSATDTTATNLNGNSVEVRVGTTIAASVKVSLDKTTYLPGEKATLTVALFDKDGLVVADGAYNDIFATGGITTNYQLGSGSDTTTATKVTKKLSNSAAVAGSVAYTVYMPVVAADVIFSWTTGGTAVTGTAPVALTGLLVANQGVKGSTTVTVSNPGTDAASAAAEEATAAANDATDAALSAAEAAEAATAMAQEAVDAVAELSASVTKLISALRAQITTLTNLVVKIQKKVKA